MLKMVTDNSIIIFNKQSGEWWHFRHPEALLSAYDYGSVQEVLERVEKKVEEEGLYAAGFISYEAAPAFDEACVVRQNSAFPLIWFALYKKYENHLPETRRIESVPEIDWSASVTETEYQNSIQKIKHYLLNGDTYQVNHTFRLRAGFKGDPWILFDRMIRAQGPGYSAFVRTDRYTICSSSPELFFSLDQDLLISKPMKGTMARGLTLDQDRQMAINLKDSQKNLAENVMIVDMVRNDMAKISVPGSVEVVKLFEVEKYPTLWQLTSTVKSRTNAGYNEIFRALFPAASITGAPKINTMRIIQELENTPRNIYTGSVGFIAPGRQAQFNVAIRTVLVDRERQYAEYGIGGGVVWDSETLDEFRESYTKAAVVLRTIPEFDLLETMLWTPEDGYFLLDAHLRRLRDSAEYFSRNIKISIIEQRLNQLEKDFTRTSKKIRIIVPENSEPVIEASEVIPGPNPYKVCIARKPVNSDNPFLYHKTTNRSVYQEALAGCPGYDDVLLWNERGELMESCIANLIVRRDGKLLTPPVACGLLPGVYRSYLLRQGVIEERVLRLDDLDRFDTLFLVNSVRFIWEIQII